MRKMPDKKEKYIFLTGDMHLDHALEYDTYERLSTYIMDYYDEKDAYDKCTKRMSYVAKRKGNIMPFSIPFKKCPASDVFLFVNGFLRVLTEDGYDAKGMLTLHDKKDYVLGLIYIEGGKFTVDTCDEKKGILRATVNAEG
jgi:hypothetical protein